MAWKNHADRPANGTCLCELDIIPNNGGYEVSFDEGENRLRLLILRQENKCWCYINNCPHFSLPLNYQPQIFVVMDDMVVCAHHTAFFKFDDGSCVDGPCAGTGLTPVPVYVCGEKVFFGIHEA